MACVVKRRGKWVVDFRDQTGKRRWETYETRRAADDALSKRIGDVKDRVYRRPVDLPTFEAVANDWLAGRKDRAASTVEFYRRQLTGHLLPAFGPSRIDQITTKAVERFRNEKRDSGEMDAGTVNSLLQRLTSILRYAVRHQFIKTNPAVHTLVERVKALRVADRVAEAVDPSDVFTAEQANAVIAAADPGLHRTFITMALLTGCRSGELLALSWSHVDLEARKVRIGRSLSWDRSGGKGNVKPVFGPPKSDSSYRTLELVPALVRTLTEWKLASRFKAPEDLLFPNLTGGPLHLSYLQKGFRRALEACPDVPVINLHGLRHTFASLLLLMNKPVTQVAKLLGHKDPSITLDTYSHWFDDAEDKNREAMGDVADAVLEPSGSKMVATAGA
jgi:integrase